jgi:hypothetical protein
MRRAIADVHAYARFAWGLRAFLGRRISLEEAHATIAARIADRDAAFLRLVERGVFGHAQSPYLPLLRLAGCELGDIRTMVQRTGLEATLTALRDAGVYVTFEEFKGRTPILRHGRVIDVGPQGFDNPHLSHYYEARSGGSSGAGTRVLIDLDHLAAQAPNLMLTHAAHGIVTAPTAIWFGVLPDHTGIGVILRHLRFGGSLDRWFTTTPPDAPGYPLKNRLANRAFVSMGRLFSGGIPRPEFLPLDQAVVVARWASQTLRDRGVCVIRAPVSRCVRISLAAQEEGLDLTGATFMGASEPPTPAKVAAITACGARWVPAYFFAEAGAVGMGCAHPLDGNDVHLLKDALALIEYPRTVPGSEVTVGAFHFTTLLPTSPKLMLNVETDDYGVVEARPCGCPLAAAGLTEHIRGIQSFSKLTGEGVTLVGTDLVRILEEVLPARFGGGPLDYQILQEEDDSGLTRLSLLVNPRVELRDEAAVIETVLQSLGRGSVAGSLTEAAWRQAKILRVKRMSPIWTPRGKLMPIHVARSSKWGPRNGPQTPDAPPAPAQPGPASITRPLPAPRHGPGT